MKKGFGAYLNEREQTDFNMDLILETKTLQQIASEFNVTTQAVHKSIRKAIDKIYNGIKSANPEMSAGEVFVTMCIALKPEDPRELFKNLGLKTRDAVADEAREMGIKV